MQTGDPQKNAPREPGRTEKSPYRAPELVVYGDIRQITRSLNVLMGNADGMMIGPMTLKTGGF